MNKSDFKLSENRGIIRKDFTSSSFTHCGAINIEGSEYNVFADANSEDNSMVIYLIEPSESMLDHQIRENQSVGKIQVNTDILNKRSPDFTGNFNIGYRHYALVGWSKLGRRSKFLSVTINSMEDIL